MENLIINYKQGEIHFETFRNPGAISGSLSDIINADEDDCITASVDACKEFYFIDLGRTLESNPRLTFDDILSEHDEFSDACEALGVWDHADQAEFRDEQREFFEGFND